MTQIFCDSVSDYFDYYLQYCETLNVRLLHNTDLYWRLLHLHTLTNLHIYFCLFLAQQPSVGHGLLIQEVSRSRTTMHYSRQDSSGRVISPSQRTLPDKTQHSQQINVHASGGIRIHNLSSRAAAKLRLRLRGHWDRPHIYTARPLGPATHLYCTTFKKIANQ